MTGAPPRAPSHREVLTEATERLAAAGSESPRLDAELLLAHAVRINRAGLVLRHEEPLDAEAAETFAALLERREAREPVAYLIGRRAFRYLDLHVDERVLVPRPETETLVEVAVEELPEGARVLDVGTGSGAVALALAHERRDLEVTATDVSDAALEVARANAQRLELDVAFAHGDLLEAAPGGWDAVVSNPPYVAEGERGSLPPELAFEPAGALFAGKDGLGVIRRLVATASSRAPWLAIEVGEGQAGPVAVLMEAAGFTSVDARRDLAGVERVVVARR